MPIYVGNTKQGELYYGGTKISEAYYGSTKVYSKDEPIQTPLYYCYIVQGLNTYTYFKEIVDTVGKSYLSYGYNSGQKATSSSQLSAASNAVPSAITSTGFKMSSGSVTLTLNRSQNDDLYT